jgi:hypothetical protein
MDPECQILGQPLGQPIFLALPHRMLHPIPSVPFGLLLRWPVPTELRSWFWRTSSREEKDAIWQLYRELHEIDPTQRQPDDSNWTGAEIKSCCRLAALLDVSLAHAAQNVVPVAITSAESIQRLRTWASGRCLSASEPGIYQHTAADSKSRRRVSREPSAN